jgi:hypothetical protein
MEHTFDDRTTDEKGAIAESAIVHAATKLGIGVFKPMTDGYRYDLIFDLESELARVQCKDAAPRVNGVILVRWYSCRRTAAGLVRRPYAIHEIDAVAAYCPHLDACFYLPADRFPGRRQVHLRVEASRNRQVRGVNHADDFRIERLQSGVPGP